MSKLNIPINISSLMSDEGCTFEVESGGMYKNETPDIMEEELKKHMLQYTSFLEHLQEDGGNSQPFERLAKHMEDLTGDGKIMKRCIRESKGDKIEKFASISIHYNGYIENNRTPFDSTYARETPHKFVVDQGEILPGLDFSVQSMRVGERAYFLVHPDYAYKDYELSPVPPNSTILFEVYVIEICNHGGELYYKSLSPDEQLVFGNICKYCEGMNETAKSFFAKKKYKKAVVTYNEAVYKMENAHFVGDDEKKQKAELLLKLYGNLLVSYLKNGKPRNSISIAEKVYKMKEEGMILKVPIKVYFNHAKSLRILQEYQKAKVYLDKAYWLAPDSVEIGMEFVELDKELKEEKKNHTLYAKALF